MALGVLTAVLVGFGVAVQAATLGGATGGAHPLVVSCALMLPGLVFGMAWGASTGQAGDVVTVMRMWWWVPLGLLGWGIVAAIAFATARLGVATTLAASVAAQLVAGTALDARAGTITVGPRVLTGLVLLLGGVVLLGRRA